MTKASEKSLDVLIHVVDSVTNAQVRSEKSREKKLFVIRKIFCDGGLICFRCGFVAFPIFERHLMDNYTITIPGLLGNYSFHSATSDRTSNSDNNFLISFHFCLSRIGKSIIAIITIDDFRLQRRRRLTG